MTRIHLRSVFPESMEDIPTYWRGHPEPFPLGIGRAIFDAGKISEVDWTWPALAVSGDFS